MSKARIVGTLYAYSDQGTEGIFWTIINNNALPHEAMVIVENGDYLFVEDGNHKIEWEGYVNLDLETNIESFPFNPKLKYQRCNDCTVHGLQAGVEPNEWFEWFVTDRPAVLIKGAIYASTNG